MQCEFLLVTCFDLGCAAEPECRTMLVHGPEKEVTETALDLLYEVSTNAGNLVHKNSKAECC